MNTLISLNFILKNFVNDNTGIPAVIGRDKSQIITPEIKLEDTALAILTLIDGNKSELIINLLDKLNKFEDPLYFGFHEVLDSTGIPNSIGYVRTPAIQALCAWAYYKAGIILKNDELIIKGKELIKWVADLMIENDWPTRLDRSTQTILEHDHSLSSISVIIKAASNITDDSPFWQDFFYTSYKQMKKHLGNHGLWAKLTDSGKPNEFYGYRFESCALGIIALCALYHRNVQDVQLLAKNLVSTAIKYYHNGNHGYWNRIDRNGIVSVEPIASFYIQHDSPFPAKLIKDHALFLLAIKDFNQILPMKETKDLIHLLYEEIKSYVDIDVGGVFEGQSCWFSTPTEPTVPLARHVMVPIRSQGSFSVGNTVYIPFHEKHAKTQFISYYATKEYNAIEIQRAEKPIKLEKWPYNYKLDYITTDKLNDGTLNLSAYLKWLSSTQNGLGYGLTPSISPLGLKSDKTPQTFSAFHVVSDLTVLSEDILDKEKILKGVYSTQNDDGGFGEQAGILSEVFTTYSAVLTAKILGGKDYNIDSCVSFLKSCQHHNGGFGNSPGYPSDCWHSNLAVLALHALGHKPPFEANMVDYFVQCQNVDGGYANQPGLDSDTFATFRVVSSLIALGWCPPNKDKTISWLQSLQTETGGFKYKENGSESFIGSYHAIAALYILGHTPLNVNKCIQYFKLRQSLDGGFSKQLNGCSETTDESFIAIQSLYMLEGKLNPYWATIIT